MKTFLVMALTAFVVGAMAFVMVYAWRIVEVFHKLLEIGVFA